MHTVEQFAPHGPVDIAERQPELAHDIGVELLGVQHLGDVVDRRGVGRGDDAVDVDVAHQRDLLLEPLGHVAIAPQDQRVGLDSDVAQSGDRVLGRLGLQLTRRREIGHQ
ncbi:Uncharacterised protein [Mycobacteroides abscessus subsp. abscessus]|nr:Uncharacterised protein [Mycobacteroides abscessus subsp. abscessus]